MSAGDQAVKQAAARRAAKMAARHGVEVAPFEESDQLLWNKFGGNVDQMVRTIAYYDEHDDQIVINHAHEAWANMRRYVQDPRRKGWYSSCTEVVAEVFAGIWESKRFDREVMLLYRSLGDPKR
jgi:hypothetical protein